MRKNFFASSVIPNPDFSGLDFGKNHYLFELVGVSFVPSPGPSVAGIPGPAYFPDFFFEVCLFLRVGALQPLVRMLFAIDLACLLCYRASCSSMPPWFSGVVSAFWLTVEGVVWVEHVIVWRSSFCQYQCLLMTVNDPMVMRFGSLTCFRAV